MVRSHQQPHHVASSGGSHRSSVTCQKPISSAIPNQSWWTQVDPRHDGKKHRMAQNGTDLSRSFPVYPAIDGTCSPYHFLANIHTCINLASRSLKYSIHVYSILRELVQIPSDTIRHPVVLSSIPGMPGP